MIVGQPAREEKESIGRLLLSVMVAFAVVLSPLAFADDHGLGLSGYAAQLSTDHHGSPGDAGHGGSKHGPAHCGTFSCAPSFLPGGAPEPAAFALSASNRGRAEDDAARRSLYPDGDPPVPRTGFSLI